MDNDKSKLYIANIDNAVLRGRLKEFVSFVEKWGNFEFSDISMAEEVAEMKREADRLLYASDDEPPPADTTAP